MRVCHCTNFKDGKCCLDMPINDFTIVTTPAIVTWPDVGEVAPPLSPDIPEKDVFVGPPVVNPFGWECPRCSRIYSPNTSECERCNTSAETST